MKNGANKILMLSDVRVWSREISERWGLRTQRKDQILKFLAIWLLIFISIFIVVHFVPYGVDWRTVFRPAARALLRLESPYSIDGYYNPPWAALALVPLAVLPESVGYAMVFLLSLASFSYTAYRLNARPSIIVVFLFSPPVLHSLLNGNIDALTVLGFVLPKQIGLFFILIKPQIGIALAFYWLFEAWRQGGIREVSRTFAPVTMILIVSFFIYGLWPLRFEQEIDLWWNASLWPASIPVGIALLIGAIIRKKKEYAIAASPFLSPYVLLHAWVGVLLALVSRVPQTLIAVIGLWVVVVLRSL
jgi:hypothetical protein